MRDAELYATILGLTAPWTGEGPGRLPDLRSPRAGAATPRHRSAADAAPCPASRASPVLPWRGAEPRPVGHAGSKCMRAGLWVSPGRDLHVLTRASRHAPVGRGSWPPLLGDPCRLCIGASAWGTPSACRRPSLRPKPQRDSEPWLL
jgi:hypothetical protein